METDADAGSIESPGAQGPTANPHRRATEQPTLRLLIELASELVGADEGSFLLLDRSETPTKELTFTLTVGNPASEQALVGQRVPLGEGVTGLAAITHEVQLGAPLYDGVQQAERRDEPVGEPQSVIAAPVLVDDELLGVITAVSFDPKKSFTSADAAQYARIAAIAGTLVDQQRRLDQADDPDAPPHDEARRALQQQIRASTARLLRADTERLPEIARLLEAAEALGQDRES